MLFAHRHCLENTQTQIKHPSNKCNFHKSMIEGKSQMIKSDTITQIKSVMAYHQAMTSGAFFLRVGFGSGLTKKLGFRVRVLCIL